MISTHYIANATLQMDLELKIVRHFLLHPHTKEARDSFVAAEMRRHRESMDRVLKQKTDRDFIDDLVAPTLLRGQKAWLENNLHLLKEFSENRLNQMELILRYTLFEGLLSKIVGNILWEYSELRTKPLHLKMKEKMKNNFPRYKKHPDPELDRFSWTKAAVAAVDRLPFDESKDEPPNPDAIYLRTYLRDVFALTWDIVDLWPNLEKLRRIRNHLIHTSMELRVSNDRIKYAERYLGNFPTILALDASKSFPQACTAEKADEEDDGKPGYFLFQQLLYYDAD
jgi:hypothetical protein